MPMTIDAQLYLPSFDPLVIDRDLQTMLSLSLLQREVTEHHLADVLDLNLLSGLVVQVRIIWKQMMGKEEVDPGVLDGSFMGNELLAPAALVTREEDPEVAVQRNLESSQQLIDLQLTVLPRQVIVVHLLVLHPEFLKSSDELEALNMMKKTWEVLVVVV